MKYTVGSLFAGVGGICLGFQQAKYNNSKYKLLWANEIDEYACHTYRTNFTHDLIQGDIEKIVNPNREDNEEFRKDYIEKQTQILKHKIDILTAGFPCQAFSIAGNRKGFDDHRGNLFWSIIDTIKLLQDKHGDNGKPKVLLLENVKNLKTHDKGRTFRVIKEELNNLGYTVKEKVLNTKNYTRLPQNRERIYIVGFLSQEVADNFTLFNNLDDIRVERNEEQRIKDIENLLDLHLTQEDLSKFYYTKEKYPHYFLTEEEYENIDEDKKKDTRINLDESIIEEYEFYQVRRGMYVRQNMNGVCPTLTANMGTGGHNVPLIRVKDGIRKLTPHETFKLQGFPIGDKYKLPTKYKGRAFSNGRLYKQAGNSVSVDIITLIATEILKALELNE